MCGNTAEASSAEGLLVTGESRCPLGSAPGQSPQESQGDWQTPLPPFRRSPVFPFTTLSAHGLCLHLACPATLMCSCMTIQLVGLYPQPGNRTLGTLRNGLSWFPPGSKMALEGLTDQTRLDQTRPDLSLCLGMCVPSGELNCPGTSS